MRIHDLMHHARALSRANGSKFKVGKPAPLTPAIAIEVSYNRALQKRVVSLGRVVKAVMEPQLPMIGRLAGLRMDADDCPDALAQALDLARTTYFNVEPPEELETTIRQFGQQTSAFQKQQLQRIFKNSIGVDVFFDDAKMLSKMNAYVQQNVDLITSIDEQYFSRVKQGLMTQIRKGDRVEEIRDWLLDDDALDLTRARAALIARDQVGKFYGELNRERQSEIGVNQYDWDTVGDERVRGTPGGRWPNGMHYGLQGQRFQWGEPPVTNSDGDRNEPGGDYQCRCTARPVLPSIF